MTSIRVVIADDHPVMRDGIRNLLDKAIDIEVAGETGDGLEALRLVEELDPDVLLLDLELPGLKGVEVAQRLQASGAAVRILALSAYNDEEYIRGLLASGAAGYLLKEEIPETIVEAIRGVARGERGWVSHQVVAQMATWTQKETGSAALTGREMEVLRLVVEGKTNQEIGLALGISDKTVEKHMEGLFAKLGVASRVEAAVHAVREGLV
jgi:DNA-binding NarL/FixJ family response regulator